MPVTVVLEQHEPKLHAKIESPSSLDRLLERICPCEYYGDDRQILASSFSQEHLQSHGTHPSSSGLVRSAIEAWGRHSHIVLRPDDFWIQILAQLNCYMTKNGESLRDIFVSHSGKKDLVVLDDNWKTILGRFQTELEENIKTPWLGEWVQGGFSTSSETDVIASSVLMMGLMSTYFEFVAEEICGIPSITLLGTREDWQRLLDKTERLKDFGEEPEDYSKRLRPLLSRIVTTFDTPLGSKTKDFWDQMVHAKVKHETMCGRPPLQYSISGWMLGLFYWKDTGSVDQQFSKGLTHEDEHGSLSYDGVYYGEAYLENLPLGYAMVKIRSPNAREGRERQGWQGWLVAGSIAQSVTEGAPQGYTEALADNDQDGLSSSSNPSVMSKVHKHERREAGCLAGILHNINCFGRPPKKEGRKMLSFKRLSYNPATSNTREVVDAEPGHSTIQPMLGWFLFGPQNKSEYGRWGEETAGPTVDAIDSCKGVEHYELRYCR